MMIGIVCASNAALAQRADEVWELVCGIPVRLK